MNRAVARALAAALVVLLATTALASPIARMEALRPLRLTDPQAFVTAVRALEAEAPPSDPLARETLQLLSATALMLEGRFDDALEAAAPIASDGSSATLRIRAGALIVNLRATTREFVDGQQRLQPLLAEAEALGDPSLRRQVLLAAAHFYNQLAQQEPAQRYAEAVLAADPEPAERCAATLQVLEARLLHAAPKLSEQRFVDAIAQCEAAGARLLRGFVDVAHAAWRVREGRADDAKAGLRARLDAITATGYPQLRARAHAQLAEALQIGGELDAAEREADAALALSAALPTGLPLLMARRTRYAVALARGDEAGALRQLQAVVAAERAYADEMRRLQEAHQAARSEVVERQQAMALLNERNARLRLEAEGASRAATMLQLVLLPVGVGLLALGAWAWRSRVQQRRLRHRMQVDPLTGLATRAHFSQQAAAALAAAERVAEPMALVLADLDRFSSINTRFGHLSGDRLLAAIGATLRGLGSPEAAFGRLGGEEFAILLPRSGLDEGLAFAERCREAIGATSAPSLEDGAPMAVSASFGVVSTTAAGYRLRDLLSNADAALYRAKNAGRNRVSAAVVVPVNSDSAA